MEQKLNFVNLADRPDAILKIAHWFVDQWGHKVDGNSVEKTCERIKGKLNRDKLPCFEVVVENEQVIAVGGLKLNEMSIYPDKPHWIGDIFVSPDRRGRGVGSALTLRLAELAKTLGVRELYLYTPDQESLYSHLGWTVYERPNYEGQQVVVMVRKIRV
jgi:N-acetylglutamate synthase-like GNAT family acetyltransferase